MSSTIFDETFSGGRYPLGMREGPKKLKQLGVRMDDGQRALLRRAAAKASRTESDWARLVLADRARAELQGDVGPVTEPDPEEAALLESLRRIEAADAALPSVLLGLGRRAIASPPLSRALKELEAFVRESAPTEGALPDRKGRRRVPK